MKCIEWVNGADKKPFDDGDVFVILPSGEKDIAYYDHEECNWVYSDGCYYVIEKNLADDILWLYECEEIKMNGVVSPSVDQLTKDFFAVLNGLSNVATSKFLTTKITNQ